MPTYVYETIGKKKRRFEVKQSMQDAPLTKDPETGEPVQRVISGGFGFIETKARVNSGPAAGSCGSGCGCHKLFPDLELTRRSFMADNKRSQLGIIFLTIFIDLIGFGIVIPVLPLYALHFGAT